MPSSGDLQLGLVLAVTLAGCNRIFALAPTAEHDAAYFDAPFDAPFQCPPPGEPVRLSPRLHQISLRVCLSYTTTPFGQAFATCETAGGLRVSSGPVDGELVELVGLEPATSEELLDDPTPYPDGNRMLVRHTDFNTSVSTHRSYVRDGGAWRRDLDPPFPPLFSAGAIVGTASGLRLVATYPDFTVHEWAEVGGSWTELRVISPGELGLDPILNVQLVADGRRAVIHGGQPYSTYYSDRQALDQPFRPAAPFEGVPPRVSQGHLSHDCARYYLTGAGYTFYLQQL